MKNLSPGNSRGSQHSVFRQSRTNFSTPSISSSRPLPLQSAGLLVHTKHAFCKTSSRIVSNDIGRKTNVFSDWKEHVYSDPRIAKDRCRATWQTPVVHVLTEQRRSLRPLSWPIEPHFHMPTPRGSAPFINDANQKASHKATEFRRNPTYIRFQLGSIG
jgi:hypothetical protein